MTVPPNYIRTKADVLAISQGCHWDEDEANRIIVFAEKYVIPQFITGDFQLLQWQKDWLRQLVGWRNASGDLRFKTVNLHIAKKNGKTLLCAVICLYNLLFSDKPSPQVVSCSTTRANASQIFDELSFSLRTNPLTEKLVKKNNIKINPSYKKIAYAKKNSRYTALSSDAGSAEGINAVCVVVDELHAHKSDKLFRSLQYATSASKGQVVSISTAGNDLTHFYYQTIYSKSKRILTGDDLDTQFFATVYESLNDTEPTDEEIGKANPSLGVSFTIEAFRRDLEASKGDTSSWLSFQRYRLNRWIAGSDEVFLDVSKWDQCRKPMSDDELLPHPVVLGVDLSQTTDPSSVSAIWILPDNRFYVRSWAWVCSEGVRKRGDDTANLPQYRQFIADSNMVMSEGDMIETEPIRQHIRDLGNKYNVTDVIFDSAGAYVLGEQCQQDGFNTHRSPMSAKFMSEPMKEFSRAVLEGRIYHDGNTWLRWCIANVRTKTDSYGQCRPDKDVCRDKIDGAVAAFLAFIICLQTVTVGNGKSVYEDRGITWL